MHKQEGYSLGYHMDMTHVTIRLENQDINRIENTGPTITSVSTGSDISIRATTHTQLGAK